MIATKASELIDSEFIVVGSGPIGRILAARLKLAGIKKVFLQTHHCNDNTVTVKIKNPELLAEVEVPVLKEEVVKPKYIFVASQVDNINTIVFLKKSIDKNTCLILFQNGIDVEHSFDEKTSVVNNFGDLPIARCIIAVEARNVLRDGKVETEILSETYWKLGAVSSPKGLSISNINEQLRTLTDFLNPRGFNRKIEVIEDIKIQQWIKYFINMGNGGCLILTQKGCKSASIAELYSNKECLEFTDTLVEEAYQIALKTLSTSEKQDFPSLEEIQKLHRSFISEHTPTTARNYYEKREIENIWEKVVEMAKKFDVAVPNHAEISRIIKLHNTSVQKINK